MKYTRKGEKAKRKMVKNKSRMIKKGGATTNGKSARSIVDRTQITNTETIDGLEKKNTAIKSCYPSANPRNGHRHK